MAGSIFSMDVPSDYGYVVLAVGGGSLVVPTLMGGAVMKARREFDVQYPNLYATPGYHKRADDFNRVQRGHQAMFESLTSVSIMTLLGGIRYPKLNGAIHVTCTILKLVTASAAEAELGALFLNAQDAEVFRLVLAELGHPQPPTPIHIDNTTTVGIVNNTIK